MTHPGPKSSAGTLPRVMVPRGTRAASAVAALLAAALLVGGCSSNGSKGRNAGSTARTQAAGARTQDTRTQGTRTQGTRTQETTAQRRGTTDPGSRYLDVAGPVGGIAVESSPLGDGAAPLPYAAPIGSPDGGSPDGASDMQGGGTSVPEPDARPDIAQAVDGPGTPPVAAGVPASAAPARPATRKPDLGLPPTGPLPAPQVPPRDRSPAAPPLPDGA